MNIHSVVIRGDKEDDAVLCTDRVTFDLRLADTSNSLLLVPQCSLSNDEGIICSILTACLVSNLCVFFSSLTSFSLTKQKSINYFD